MSKESFYKRVRDKIPQAKINYNGDRYIAYCPEGIIITGNNVSNFLTVNWGGKIGNHCAMANF